jgi:hypothetical protein
MMYIFAAYPIWLRGILRVDKAIGKNYSGWQVALLPCYVGEVVLQKCRTRQLRRSLYMFNIIEH